MRNLLLVLLILFSLNGFSQISYGGSPLSFTNNLTSVAPTHTLTPLNTKSYISEDMVTDAHKDIPWRFGIERVVNLDLTNSGVWETLANGDRIWRLEIISPNALSLNLNYNAFYIPIGASFFVFNKNQTLGAFTHLNNKATNEFSTAPIKGESVILEYYEPISLQGQGIIHVSSVVHGYRDFFEQLKAFNSSGSCNVNTICDTSMWGNEIRSSVMLLTAGNTRFCSGALIANVPQDGTPFILTANHCSPSTNNIFMFNYQSSDCASNIDGPTFQTISGCILRANDTPSDFYLVELSSTPPSNYNVFYAGWSNINSPPTKGTGIHHPAGDIKKISHDTDPLVESGYYTTGNDHWEILDWNSGTTEGGSSGSPLFDQNHRIVGQLHGGDAACNNDDFDYYGKFAISWNTNASTNKQLKFWLDPSSTGATTNDGYDPNGANLTTDAVLLDIDGIIDFVCGDTIFPKITIRNNGSSNLTSLAINYELDALGATLINWSGNLSPFAIETITLPATYVSSGAHIFKASCTNPNGINDENLTNDSSSINFNSNAQPIFATLNLTTDNFGAETSWLIRDFFGNPIISGGGYQNTTGGELISENLCLYDSCFTFVLNDSYGDGYCCSFGNGEFQLLNNFGDTIAEDYTFSGDSLTFPFCLGTSTNIAELNHADFNIYPNPNSGIFTIENNFNEDYTITIYDILGNITYQKNETENKIKLNLSHITKGIYLVSITTTKVSTVTRIIIN
jgi:lysyl endopeptidase